MYKNIIPGYAMLKEEKIMNSIFIKRLKCHETEDYFGKDTCRLEIYADGNKNVLKKNMGNGETWTINKQYQYNSNLEIKLYDEDSADSDDHLGTIKVENKNYVDKIGKFTQDGADYTIYYNVTYEEPRPAELDSKILHIKSLKCYETEDSFGADEAKLIIDVDGVKTVLKRSLNDNQSWNINREFSFSTRASVSLYDEDDPDDDDHLGTVNISKNEIWNATAKFTNHGANYSLFYDVKDPEKKQEEVFRKLTLMSIKCDDTEDYLGADELRLEIYVDGAYVGKSNRSLNTGQTWNINKSYNYTNNVEIKLWDEDTDWWDPDDLLGHVVINTNLASRGMKRFKLDDSDYTLIYKVETAQQVFEPAVSDLINEFSRSTARGVWPKINKADLIRDIKSIVIDPLRINQGAAPLCGPAAILYELAKSSPKRFVEMCRKCYETGTINGRKKNYSASSTLRNSKVKNNVTPANWMMQATLVEASNLLLDVDASDDGLASSSTPSNLQEWTKEILLYDRVDYISTLAWGEFDAMREVARAYRDGGVAFMMVHSSMVGNPTPFIYYMSHWISYAGKLHIDNGNPFIHDSGHISFDSYTWGRIVPVSLSEGRFEDAFFGVVIGYK